MGALKRVVLSHLSPRESKGLLMTQLIANNHREEVVMQLLTRIEGLEVVNVQGGEN